MHSISWQVLVTLKLKAVHLNKEDKMNNAIITIKSIQFDGTEKNVTEVITEGSFKETQEGFEIEYKETDATGFQGSSTKLLHSQGKLHLIRSGSANSDLLIEADKKNYCLYGTPYGELTVGVMGKEVNSLISSVGGKITASYVLDINSAYVGDYEIELTVKLK